MIAAFDFDHTIINDNSDTYINKLVSGEKISFPRHVEDAYKTGGWTLRMQAVFDYMHKELGIKENDFINCLQEIKIDDSMRELFYLLKVGY